jgi:hypothetical protein
LHEVAAGGTAAHTAPLPTKSLSSHLSLTKLTHSQRHVRCLQDVDPEDITEEHKALLEKTKRVLGVSDAEQHTTGAGPVSHSSAAAAGQHAKSRGLQCFAWAAKGSSRACLLLCNALS